MCRQHRSRRRLLRLCRRQSSPLKCDLPAPLSSLQGDWEDCKGLLIQVEGSQVDFKDGTGPWTIEEVEGGFELRGAKLSKVLPGLPIWRFPNGQEFVWTRPDPAQLEDASWAGVFLTYKTARLLLRRRLLDSLNAGDADAVAGLTEAWEGGWGFLSGTSVERQARLQAGRYFIVGSCIRHRLYGVRGVIIACEPWVGAGLARRLPAGPESRLQPLYHVLLDERDVPGGHATVIPESDLLECESAFPIQGEHVAHLMRPVAELSGYLPGPKVMEALRRQLHDQPMHLRS